MQNCHIANHTTPAIHVLETSSQTVLDEQEFLETLL